MGKTGTDKAAAVITLREASNNSQKQGFLTVMVKKAPHGLVVKRLEKSQKGFKSGELPSLENYVNDKAKKGKN